MFAFDRRHFFLTLILLLTEIAIALFVTDKIIRPFVGDVLVIVLLYCFVCIFLNADRRKIAVGALLFACLIEILQYFDYVARLGLENNRVLSVMLGRTFEWSDFAAYLTGFLIILFCEKIYRSRNL